MSDSDSEGGGFESHRADQTNTLHVAVQGICLVCMVIIEPAALCSAGSSKRSFCEAKLYFGYSYFILPYIQYRSLGNLKDAVNAFTFSGGGFMVVGKTLGNFGESEIA